MKYHQDHEKIRDAIKVAADVLLPEDENRCDCEGITGIQVDGFAHVEFCQAGRVRSDHA